MSAFAAQRAAAHAAAAQLTAALETFDALDMDLGSPAAAVAMNCIMERACTAIRRVNELCDTVAKASPYPIGSKSGVV